LLFGKLGTFAFGEAVAEGPEPLIQGERAASVITFEVAMVKVMEITARGYFPFNQRAFETVMAVGGTHHGVLHREEGVKRVGRHDPMDSDYAQVEQGFHWMHGHARPGVGVDILMVQVVHVFVERLPMAKTVDPIEMEITPYRDHEKP